MALSLMRLEERIVLDAAGGATLVKTAAEAGKTAAESGGVKVLVVSSDVKDAKDLIASAKSDVIAVFYDASKESSADILAKISLALNGQKASSIAFAAHETTDGAFELTRTQTVSAPAIDQDASLRSFWQGIGGLLTEGGRVDLLACDLAGTARGDALVAALQSLTGHEIAASTDATGNSIYGGDWILEKGGVDAEKTYFDSAKLAGFDDLLVANTGTLDTSFNTTGILNFTYSPGTDYPAEAFAEALQSDGKLVVVGKYNNGTNDRILVARYNTDGSLDTTFGSSGYKSINLGGSADVAKAVVIQSDGKILVAGYTSSTLTDFAVVRLNSDGSVDTSFGTVGVKTVSFGVSVASVSGIALQSDGKIIVSGSIYSGATTKDDFAMARLNTDGSLDTGFGTAGKVVTDFNSNSDFAYSVAVQSDGKILLAGSATMATQDFAIARYNTDGSLDTGFGTGGKVTIDFTGYSDRAYSVALSGSSIYLAGYTYTYTATSDFAVAKLTSTGALDTSFNATGKATADFGHSMKNDVANGMAIQQDDKIVLAGYAYTGTTTYTTAMLRFNSDGSLDTTFGTSGKVETTIGSGNSMANGVTINTDGRIILVGTSVNATSTKNSFTLARYGSNNAPTSVTSAVAATSDASYTFTAANFNFSDPNAGDTLHKVMIVTLPGSGSITLSGATVSAGQAVTLADITAGNLKYVPNSTTTTSETTSFTFKVNDGSVYSVSAYTMNVTVTHVNVAPVNTVPSSQSLSQNSSLTFSSGNGNQISVSDVDAGTSNVKVTLSVNSGTLSIASSTTGAATTGDGTSSLAITGTLSQINTAINGLVYRPTTGFYGSDTLTMVSDDLGHTGSGGSKTSTSTVSLSVTHVNEAPVNTVPGLQTLKVNSSLSFSTVNGNAISVSDSDAGSSTIQTVLSVSHGVVWVANIDSASVSNNGTSQVTLYGSVSQINSALQGLVYKPNSGYSGLDSLLVYTNDLGYTGQGGAKYDSKYVQIQVQATQSTSSTGATPPTYQQQEQQGVAGNTTLGQSPNIGQGKPQYQPTVQNERQSGPVVPGMSEYDLRGEEPLRSPLQHKPLSDQALEQARLAREAQAQGLQAIPQWVAEFLQQLGPRELMQLDPARAVERVMRMLQEAARREPPAARPSPAAMRDMAMRIVMMVRMDPSRSAESLMQLVAPRKDR